MLNRVWVKCHSQALKNRRSVLNRVGKSGIWALNRVRVWAPRWQLPTQASLESPPHPPTPVPFIWPIKSKNYERSRDSAHEIQLWCSHSFILISQLTQTPGGSWQKDVETLTTTNQKLWSNIYQQYQQIWKCQGQAVSITELRSYRSWYLTDRLTVKRLLWQQPLGSWQKDVKKLTIKNFAQVALVRSTASSRSKNA